LAFPKCAVYDVVNGLILIFPQRTSLQSVKQHIAHEDIKSVS